MNMKSLFPAILLVVALSAAAQEKHIEISPAPRFLGATVFGRYSLDPPVSGAVETSFIAGLSGAYETVGYYRNADGSMFPGGDADLVAEQTLYKRFDLYWQAGIQQGLIPRKDISDDLAVAFLFYRGRYDRPRQDDSLFFSSPFPDTEQGLIGSLHGGAAFSNVVDTPSSGVRSGVQAELAVQWGPSFLHNNVLGSADFIRTTFSARAYLPVFERVGQSGSNLFSVYSAAFAAVDWAAGQSVPISVRSTFGTRSERPGLGGSVRGFESNRFDATLKAVANGELRANLPAISIGDRGPLLVPGILVYADVGYYNDLEGLSPVAAEQSGTLVSGGAGFYLDVRGITQVVLYSNMLASPGSLQGRIWVPLTVGFAFHF